MTDKQRKFADEYLIDCNATRAYKAAYLTFKLKEKGELKLDENGKIKGIDDSIAALKTQFPKQFITEQGKKVDENKLPGSDDEPNNEPQSLADALKAAYETKN